jgi:hypothetical protein
MLLYIAQTNWIPPSVESKLRKEKSGLTEIFSNPGQMIQGVHLGKSQSQQFVRTLMRPRSASSEICPATPNPPSVRRLRRT